MFRKPAMAVSILVGSLSTLGALLVAGEAHGQEKPKSERFTARARGENRAAGKIFSVEITISSYSTPADKKALIDAFRSGGHDALVKTLRKWIPKAASRSPGRLATKLRTRAPLLPKMGAESV